MKLRPYQEAGVRVILNALRTGRTALCVAATGAGKTEMFIDLTRRAQCRTVILVGRDKLVEQTARRMRAVMDDVKVWSAGQGEKEVGKVTVVSIHSADSLMIPDLRLLIIDEAHNVNGGRYESFIKRHPVCKIAGFTATPWRNAKPIWGDDKLFPIINYRVGLKKLIDEGYLCRPIVRAMPEGFDTSTLTVRDGEFVMGELSALTSDKGKILSQVKDAIPRIQDRNKVVWTCTTIEHAEQVDAAIRALGETSVLVHSKVRDIDHAMECFENGPFRHAVSVMMLSEGIDIPSVDAIVLMRPTRSPTLMCLDEETEILTSNGWKGMGQISTGDVVPSMDMNNGKGKWSRVLNYVERDLDKDESFVAYDAPRCNFRVTSDHRMIYKPPVSGRNKDHKSKPWIIDKARKLPLYKDNIYIPTAVEIDQPGIPLRDCEIYFIGMMMSDGSWTNVAGNIYQSARYPKVVERIEKCLHECGISYSKRLQKIDNKNSYIQRYERYVFSFSAGKPRESKARTFTGVTGYRHLLPYMDKDLSTMLMSMSKSQFLLLVQGLWDGDGSKKKSVDYTPRSWEICSARKNMVDRLQALASIHGFTANVRVEQGKSRAKPLYVITISPQSWRSIHGLGKRPKIHFEEQTKKERVWCIETEHGTIVTRRKGKVTVMGNCQTVGRGLRLHPGKKDCVVLDYGQVIANCGPINDPYIREGTRTRTSEPLNATIRVCPECLCYVPISEPVCPECGFEDKKVVDRMKELTRQAAMDAMLSANEPETFNVLEVSISQYKSRKGNDCIRLTFRLDGRGQYFNMYASSHPFSWGKIKDVLHDLTPFRFSSWQEAYDAVDQLSGYLEPPKSVTIQREGEHEKLVSMDA